ncbi:MAG: DUF1566 domain-containing protein [Deltaproteobacteria bacterium]|nr:DUF1566 domain-containing protein [Deltaproteobacteria bacterium]
MKKFIFSLLIIFTSCSNPPEGTGDNDCSDNKDNDKNGFVDCEDQGCNLDDYCLTLAAKALDAQNTTKKTEPEPVKTLDNPKSESSNPYYVEFEKIMIQKSMSTEDVNWSNAEKYCKNLSLSGFIDWRLPTEDEAIQGVNSPEIEKDSLVMWTSTKKSNKRALIVGISTGAINELSVNSKGQCRARCVRDNK